MPVKKLGKKTTRKPTARAAKSSGAGETRGGISSDAVAKATGKPWREWCKLLDKDGAAKLSHKEIALHLRDKYGVGDWWCQMVTVGYEQARGLRVKHQTATGYVANLSKTLPVTMAAAFKAVADAKQRGRWLDEAITVSKATPGKSVRMAGKDGTRIVVGFWDKTGKTGSAKTQIVFQHEKLKNAAAVTKSKKLWADRLVVLAAVLGL